MNTKDTTMSSTGAGGAVSLPTTTEFSPLRWAMYHQVPVGDPTMRLVLLYLAAGCDIVRPTTIVDTAQLARWCGCSTQTAWTCLAGLEQAGVIRRSKDQTRALIRQMRLHTSKRPGKQQTWEWECLAWPSQHRGADTQAGRPATTTADGTAGQAGDIRARRPIPQHTTGTAARKKGRTR